ncbi:ROK family transcriptional regulator [Demequina sp. NBRC 110052]|uniref:ROK family transcriptional regulator n=1 Tax=Demequina sp. NBRC 110052 TaxID=1570341 RepID=UPI0013565AFC|nr:ROK family transcriptional regulator [Demequina sp. NBRC 110052]
MTGAVDVWHGHAGTRPEQSRRRNLATVMRYLHRHGATPRSDLTRVMGLNRSTMGALVSELLELRLIHEEAAPPDRSRVGRPSPVLRADESVVALAINPESDAVRVGVVGLGGVVHGLVKRPVDSPLGPVGTVEVVRELVAGAPELVGRRVVGAAVAMPGLVDEELERVVVARNLGWEDVPLAAMLSDALSLPVTTANDANVGALAESLFGAGQGVANLVYVNGSASGIGAGLVLDGRVVRGSRSFAGEFGHVQVAPMGPRCRCGLVGCLETVVSLARLREAAGDRSVDLNGLDALFAAAPAGGAVHAELDRQVERLAPALAMLVTTLAPERIVLGGLLGAILTARAEALTHAVAEAAMPQLAERVTFERNRLREHMMPLGAAELAFGPLLDDPAALAPGLSA